VKPATNTLKEIFQADIRLVVPIYQRPYVWERDRHWEPLWDDVQAVLERRVHAGEEPLRHFLGAVVLDEQRTALGEAPRRLIIDGQQRLTTLQLLLAAARRNAEDDGSESHARLLAKLVENDHDVAVGDARFKVWPTTADQAAFRSVMTSGDDNPSGDGGRIAEAHNYFRLAIKVWLDAESPDAVERERRHKGLYVALSELLQVVSINLEREDNAQVIFETLNARGTPLFAMDLVKNAVFYKAEREGADVDRLNREIWEPELGRDYWRQNVRQGRLNRPRAELFLMHWLAMKLGRIIAATELFSEFRGHVLSAPGGPDAQTLAEELCADAAVLRSFDDRPVGTVEERFFRHLDALDTTTVIPIALLLYRSDDVSEEQRHAGLLALESWLVRRMLCGQTAASYNRLMAELLRAVRGDLDHADEVIVGFLSSSGANSAIWPTDEMVRAFLTTRTLYGYISQKRIVMVFSALELRLRQSSKIEDIYTLPTNLTVEHVMPQKWAEHWPLREGGFADTREEHINRLGNLTLTSGSLNSSLSNGPWSTKRSAIVQHSLLRLNQLVAAEETWDEATIDARGEQLAEQIFELWPGPDHPMWPSVEEPHATGEAQANGSAVPPTQPTTTASPRGSFTAADGRDFSRFQIVVDGAALPAENKRNSVRVMVAALLERDVPFAALRQLLGGHLRSIDGEPSDLEAAFHAAYPTVDIGWWYTEHPIRVAGNTWFLDKAWGAETEAFLNELAGRFPEAGVTARRVEEAEGPGARASGPVELQRDKPWQPVGAIEGFVAKWPEGEEPYGPMELYETIERGEAIRLAIGAPSSRLNLYGRERGWLSVWQVRNGRPARQLANFLETDAFEANGLRAALISGMSPTRKANYSPEDAGSLPSVYERMNVAVQRDVIDGPNSRNRLAVLASGDDVDDMLDHALVQLRVRTEVESPDADDGAKGSL
jgi:hypothetical protein